MIHLKWCFVAKTLSWTFVEFIEFLLDEGMIMDSNVSGGQITFGKEILGTVTVGRYNSNPDVNNGNLTY